MAKDKQTLGERLFINRDYGLLFWGRLVSQVGDGVHYLALTWLVLDLTGSGTALGTMLFASSIPMVLLAPFTGVLADLWNRKVIVVSMDVLRGLILVSLALIYRAGQLNMGILYVATISTSLCGVLFGPAISATIPGLVKKEELVKANSLNQFSRAATMIVGPVFGAFLMGTTGYFGVFLINGIAFLLSALSETFIRFPVREQATGRNPSPSRQFMTTFKEGFTYIWHNAGLRTLIFFAAVLNFVCAPLLNVVFPYFGKEVLLLEAQQYGTIQAALPAGFLLGTVLVGYLTKKFRKESLLTSGITMQGLVVGMLGFFAIPAIYGRAGLFQTMVALSGSLFLIGVLNTLVNVPFQVMLQETVPDGYRGRVYGLIDSIGQMLVPLSLAFSGVLVDSFSTASLFIVCGLITAALGLRMAASAKIKLLYATEDAAYAARR